MCVGVFSHCPVGIARDVVTESVVKQTPVGSCLNYFSSRVEVPVFPTLVNFRRILRTQR